VKDMTNSKLTDRHCQRETRLLEASDATDA